jgi:antitoxin component YwqK of YwqJK toxin-antitoxin module
MKALIIAFFASLLLFGCGSSDLDDPKTLDDIIAKAIDEDKLQERGKVGEELCYIPNAQTPYSGWAKSIYENGQVKQLRQLKDGKLEGLQTFWYEHGQKKEEANFKDGIEDGLSTEWYDNGQKKEEANFKDGKLDGLVTWWYQNGQKSQEQNWKDDKKNGLEIEWDQNGQKEEEENWKDGKKDGLSTEWYDNGQKASEVIFKDDKAVSATMWKPNGEKCPITNFVGGNGVVVEYNEKSGAVRRRWTFKNGEPVVD